MSNFLQEMRLESPEGEPLYLNKPERERFLEAVSKDTNRNAVIFCTLLHYTGARPTELRELTVDRVLPDVNKITLKTLKQRKKDKHGKTKQPKFRTIPIPPASMNLLVLAFDIRARQKKKDKGLLWPSKKSNKQPIDAKTAHRWVKVNMEAANITGKKATSKGLRHGFGINMVEKLPLPTLQYLMGCLLYTSPSPRDRG